MGNAVLCQEPKKKPTRGKQSDRTPKKVEISESAPQSQRIQQQQQVKTPKTQQVDSYNCQVHSDEPIKAVCMCDDCQHNNKILCVECLIDYPCSKKLRISDYLRHLRSCLSKDAQEAFMELFDEKNQVKSDLNRQITAVIDMVLTKLSSIGQQYVPILITNYYWASQKLPLKLKESTIHQLELILENKANEAHSETLDFAIYLIQNRGVVETMCEQIERKKNKITEFSNDFVFKFNQVVNKYLTAVEFLFHLLTTPMEYLLDDDQKPQLMNKRVAQNKDQSNIQSRIKQNEDKSNITSPKESQQINNQQNQQQQQKINFKCLAHNQEVLAICVKMDCQHKDRKMCADCLIDTKCVDRMKMSEFSARLSRILNKEIIEQLAIPWDDLSIHKGIEKLFSTAGDNIRNILTEQLANVKDMFVKYHLIEESTPKELRGQFTKEYFDQFIHMMTVQKIASNNPAVILGIKFINNKQLIDNMLSAIVKTEQVLPKKADKLQHKLVSISQLFLEKIQNLMDLYKQHGEIEAIQKQYQLLNNEPFCLEESIYKIKQDGKSLSEWEPFHFFKPSDKNIIDVCFVNENLAAIAIIDGTIIIYNVNLKKPTQVLKHGIFVFSLRAFQFNGQSVLLSSGYSPQTGNSLCSWDLKSLKPTFVVQQAHNNSIRKIKYLHINPQFSQNFFSNNNTTVAQLSSQVSQTGSMNSIFLDIDEQILSCSDDGIIKLWKIDTNLKLVEEQILKQGQQVLDFTLLNGCILVSANNDKTVSISLPFSNINPFQYINDDCLVYAVSPIDQLISKKKQTVQQKFITGNEKGIAKIFQWQNGRAVIMKQLNLHEDKITKISMLQPGFIASVSNDKSISLTLIQQAKVLTKIEKHEHGIVSFAYLKANGFMITADQGGNAILWR
ncbi:unnamed protein product [Paramecium octaurelia]|uniref:Uncharacterized protein n=1 Tax=Paramecium octaurelia TaxID=43137 RepID=A0A8S1U432_PAROT|nr:unnamed protein product [Paramecium octaurelia]